MRSKLQFSGYTAWEKSHVIIPSFLIWRDYRWQRWSPRGRPWRRGCLRVHILKSFASKVKSLASRPQVLENWPVLGSRTALFLNCWNFVERLKNFLETVCGDRLKNFCEDLFFFFGDRLKNFCEDLFFFGEHLRLCPWSLALTSSNSVLDLESVCPRKGCPWPWPRIFFVSLASSLVSSTPPLIAGSQVSLNQSAFQKLLLRAKTDYEQNTRDTEADLMRPLDVYEISWGESTDRDPICLSAYFLSPTYKINFCVKFNVSLVSHVIIFLSWSSSCFLRFQNVTSCPIFQCDGFLLPT